MLARPPIDCSEEEYRAWLLQPREGGDMWQVSFHVKTWGPGYSFVTRDEARALAQVGRETDRLFVKVAPHGYMPYAEWKREQAERRYTVQAWNPDLGAWRTEGHAPTEERARALADRTARDLGVECIARDTATGTTAYRTHEG